MWNKKTVLLHSWFQLFFVLLMTPSAFASIDSAEIISDTLLGLPACLHYEVLGTCFWLTPEGATIATPYVQHYLPDVVVSVFNQNDGNPWLEIHDTFDQAGQLADESMVKLIADVPAAGGQHSFQTPLEQHVFFKQVDVIGNPALPLLPTAPVLLPAAAIPLLPYFQSMLDSALWRGFPPQALPEQAYAYGADVTHYIGSGLTIWGGVYPYEGKTFAGNDWKAGAVIAQRAVNMLTASNEWGHIYKSLPINCGTECEAATIHEDDDQTQFQAIYPAFSSLCEVFGRSSSYGENVKAPADGAYLWIMWRRYQGCIPAPGCMYINKIVI